MIKLVFDIKIMVNDINHASKLFKITKDESYRERGLGKSIELLEIIMASMDKTNAIKLIEVSVALQSFRETIRSFTQDGRGKDFETIVRYVKDEENKALLVGPVCHMCGAKVSEDEVCVRCEEPVCFDCMAHGSYVETIEECRCKNCHDAIQRW